MTADFDTLLPAVVAKMGTYPLAYGLLGAVRSLGEVGISVTAFCEDRFVPYAFSRYLDDRIILPPAVAEDGSAVLARLIEHGSRVSRRSVLLTTDDKAAIVIAEHAALLEPFYLFPPIPAHLPRALTNKSELHDMLVRVGTPTPRTQVIKEVHELSALADSAEFPLVLKNNESAQLSGSRTVGYTAVVSSRDELLRMIDGWTHTPELVVQEYIPYEGCRDWIVNGYYGAESLGLAVFAARKYRAWPPRAGVAADVVAARNPELIELSNHALGSLGYRGVVGMDWRWDPRDGQYKLVDVNPRIMASFRIMRTEDGMDVVKAAHLDLSGRAVPVGPQAVGRRLIVENLFAMSKTADRPSTKELERRESAAGLVVSPVRSQREFAWLSSADPWPSAVAAVRFADQMARKVYHRVVARARRQRG